MENKKKKITLELYENEWAEIKAVCKDFKLDENFTLGVRLILHYYNEKVHKVM